MDMRITGGRDDTPQSGGNEDNRWTDEKHLHFLRLMEATFVKSMLQKDDGVTAAVYYNKDIKNGHCCPHRHRSNNHCRLDRYVPDMSESTLDTKNAVKRRKYTSSSSDSSSSDPRTLSRTSRLRRRLATVTPQDQVVPHWAG